MHNGSRSLLHYSGALCACAGAGNEETIFYFRDKALSEANALARLTPASGPQPRISSGFGGWVGGFWGGFCGRAAAAKRPRSGRKTPEFPDLLLKLEKRARARFSSFNVRAFPALKVFWAVK